MAHKQPDAEVVSVFPDKVRIRVNDIDAFQSKGEPLAVGSYVKIYDKDDCSIIAIVENFSIELSAPDETGKVERSYVLEAVPLGLIDSTGKFNRGGNNIAIPPKDVRPAEK